MVTNLSGIIKCFEEDFINFYNHEYLDIFDYKGDNLIRNKYYNFIYNHESPGHANLYITQGWKEGINHYINNNFYHFKKRYERRVNNFRNYLLDKNNYITFVITTWDKTEDNMIDLKNAIEKHYPNLKYEFHIINDPNGKDYYIRHLKGMGYTEADYEIKRLL